MSGVDESKYERSRIMLYVRNGVRVGMTHVQGRKKPVLVVGNEYALKVIASFSNEESADEYERYMRTLLDGLVKEQENE